VQNTARKKVALMLTGAKVFLRNRGLAPIQISRTTASSGHQQDEEEIQILEEICGHVYITQNSGVKVITLD
jgi:hypothetical protein